MSVGECDAPTSRASTSGIERLRQPEVEDLDCARPGTRSTARLDLDVGRLEVAVDDALGVRGFETLGDLDEKRKRLLERDGAALDAVGECRALDHLHGQEVRRLGLLEPVDGGDVGVVERRQHPRFALEARQSFGIDGYILRQCLDRDVAPEPRVARAVDHTHASRPERGDDLVGADAGAGLKRH